jgi:hypothetical protein
MRINIIGLLSVLLCIYGGTTEAQYYYRDVWTNQQISKELAILKTEGIRTISVKSFDEVGEPSTGFFCEKRMDRNYTRSEMKSKSDVTEQSVVISLYNSDGRIIKTTDSTESATSHTDYKYDDKGRLKKVTTYTKGDDDSTSIGEEHDYFYAADGTLQKMNRRKLNVDYSVVNFKVDEKGNIIEEEEIVKGQSYSKYLYYYDAKNNMTDVVHFNERVNRLLPDFMYEYDEDGKIVRLVSTQQGGSDYVIWRYSYNDKNLKSEERAISKEKKLMGYVEYQYSK